MKTCRRENGTNLLGAEAPCTGVYYKRVFILMSSNRPTADAPRKAVRMSVIPKLGLTLKEAQSASSTGRNTLLEAIRSGELPAAFIGAEESKRKKIVIRAADLDDWLTRKSRAA